MSEKYVEKTFLYLIALSVFIHLAIFGLIALIPPEKNKAGEPTMVDLADLPEPPPKKKITKAAERPQRVREAVPKGRKDTGRPQQAAKAARPSQSERTDVLRNPPARQEQANRLPQVEAPISRGEGLFKPKTETRLDRTALFPAAMNMARIEESYREKYGPEAENGDTKYLDTDDIRFGSFLHHLENAVYANWRYPLEARQRGIEGVTPVKITFNRSGEIVQVKLLDSSGSSILDDEVLRTLKQLGPIGSFPKGYTRETFSLIAFFQYSMGRGMLR